MSKTVIIRNIQRSGSVFLAENLANNNIPTIKYGCIIINPNIYDQEIIELFRQRIEYDKNKKIEYKTDQEIFNLYQKESLSVITLRNPIDSIKSDAVMIAYNSKQPINEIEENIDTVIDSILKKLNLIDKNIDYLVPFTFEQLIQSPDFVLKNISYLARGTDIIKNPITVDQFKQITRDRVVNSEGFKYLPTSKDMIEYLEVEKFYNKKMQDSNTKNIIEKYEDLKNKIYIKQKEMNIKNMFN